MKKRHLGLAIIVLTSMSLAVSCDNNNENAKDLVQFHTGYESLVVEAQKPDGNGKIKKPSLDLQGYTLFGYYTDPTFDTEFNFDDSVGKNGDIYIKILKGSGTETSPFLVESGLSLNAVTHMGSEIDFYVEITNDIEATLTYTSSYESTLFNGKLNGNNHKITLTEEGNNAGVFYKVGNTGEVKNVKLVGSIEGSHASTGGIANYNYGTISSIVTTGTQYHESNGCSNGISLMTTFDAEDSSIVVNYFGTLGQLSTLQDGGAGGVSGTNYGTISNCVNKMRVSATIGGGSMAGINYGRIENCFNQGAIGTTGNNSVNSTTIRDPEFSYSYIGGMAGANFGTIHQCANLNQVFVARLPWLYSDNPAGQSDFSDRIRVGGIAGYNCSEYNIETHTYNGGIITECVNYGRIHGDMQVGGIAGYTNGYISDCFSAGLIGGRDAVGVIAGWQPGDHSGDHVGTVTNCAGFARVVSGNTNNVFDEDGNTYPTVLLTDSSNGGSNIHDYFKVAKYASNCVYHNNSGNDNPIDPITSENTSTSSTATMSDKAYEVLGYEDEVETGIWTMESKDSTTAIVGINSSWQVYLHLRLAWQTKTIKAVVDGVENSIVGVAGIDYINTVLAAKSGKYTSSWKANLSGAIEGRGLPTVSCGADEKVIWVTTQNDASTEWDGLLTDNITVYPMIVKK
ncbi:MAG: hypothetical protein ACI311_07445 [Bacilli bacterium]